MSEIKVLVGLHALRRLWRRTLPLSLPASGGWWPSAFPDLRPPPSSLCLWGHVASPSSVSGMPPPFLEGHLLLGIGQLR